LETGDGDAVRCIGQGSGRAEAANIPT